MVSRIAKQQKQLYEMCARAIVAKRANIEGAHRVGFDVELPILSVGRTAELAQMHPQTLRQYDRLGLVVPQRTQGGARRYSLRDLDRLVQAQHLSQDEGINLNGVTRILELEEQLRQLHEEIDILNERSYHHVFAADSQGSIVQMQRSHNARHWRHRDTEDALQLPAGPSVHERVPAGAGHSRAVIVWRDVH